MLKKIGIFIFCFFVVFMETISVNAETEIPKWVYRPSKETSVVKYFKGWGEGKTKSEARINAEKDVRYQALSIFGEHIENSYESYQDAEKTSVNDRLKVSSNAILVSFEKQDEYIMKRDDMWEYHVLYSYPKKEIEKERERLEKIKNNPSLKGKMNTVGFGQEKGVLIVDTKGIVADLYVDDEKYGVVPIRINSVLNPGVHNITIDSPYYETVKQQAIIVPNQETKIEVTLKTAYSYLGVETDIEKATIYVNDKEIGKSPVYGIKMPAGKKISITAKHKEADTITKEVVLEKNDNFVVRIPLEKKKSKINIYSTPSKAKVFIDKQPTGLETPVENFDIVSGNHLISLYLSGYSNESEIISVGGGEKKSFRVKLKKLDDDVDEEKPNYVRDKNHTFKAFMTKKALAASEVFSSEFIEKNQGFSYLRPIVSYKKDQKGATFFIRIDINDKIYQKNYVEPLKEILTRSSFLPKVKEVSLDMNCMTKDKEFGYWCSPVDENDDTDTAYIRVGKIQHGFLSDSAPFLRIQNVPYVISGQYELKNMEVYVSAFDKENKNVTSFRIPFYMNTFQKIRNMYVFSPSLQKEKNSICKKDSAFASGKAFECSSTELFMEYQVPQIDINKIQKVFIAIGVKVK